MAQEDVDLAHDNEDVMLAPQVFAQACSKLTFHPTVDMFGNAQNHQVPRYMFRAATLGPRQWLLSRRI